MSKRAEEDLVDHLIVCKIGLEKNFKTEKTIIKLDEVKKIEEEKQKIKKDNIKKDERKIKRIKNLQLVVEIMSNKIVLMIKTRGSEHQQRGQRERSKRERRG